MKLRDRLYLRFGLFSQRYGRMWCAFFEGLLVGTVLLVSLLVLYGAAQVVTWVYYLHLANATHERVQAVEKERAGYERVVIACLNKQWFVANGELFTCEAK